MGEMFVMRRANGNLLTEESGGKLRIPVWSSEDAAKRYKERNPKLMTFLPARLTRSLIDKIGGGLATAGAFDFSLLPEDDPRAELEDGKPTSLEEIFPGGERTPQPAELQL